MSNRITEWFKKRKTEHQRALEPFSLSPNPILLEGKIAGLIAVPFLVFISVLLYVATTYYLTQEEFAIMSILGLVIWICMLIMIFAFCMQEAAKRMLFDREFGYTERLHPRCEIYCKPEDIRELINPEDTINNIEDLEARMQQLGLQKDLIPKIKEGLAKQHKQYLYYFKHKDAFFGWDAEKHEVPMFKSHLVFQLDPFDRQYVFGAGQENWYGPIFYNHSHAESDNVKVIGWALDFFTNEPMPVCVLIHSSISYKRKRETENINLTEAQQMLIAHQHGMIDSFRQKVGHLTVLKDSKFHDVKNIITFGKDIAKADRELESEIMKPVSRNLFAKGWVKALITIVTIGAIVFLIAYFMHWIDLSGILG
ncbi:MAG: hypothetical protein OEY22_01760 [Candidatus Bathyarchaeota archaeon]|nr:hypothetical protein [Candidatus Bathyarchaeota archaeon]MDH5787451.1 hypothetical protein [Candidatus Bathyarchaeota archaeon]